MNHFLSKTLLAALLFPCFLFSQGRKEQIDPALRQGGATKSTQMLAPLQGELRPPQNDRLFQPALSHEGGENEASGQDALNELKAEKAVLKFSQRLTFPPNEESFSPHDFVTPTIGRDFQGNSNNGCPPDHTVAISNGGKIISLVNSNIECYDENGNYLNGWGLWDFYGDPNLPNHLCDPKVVYDSGADRFIFYSQVCDGIANNSKVLLAFSQTNDPSGYWWWYQITGNPMNDGSWFDYPKVGVSTNEFYVTGNLFYQGGGYNQSLIYQIDKWSGYNGQSLNWQYWNNISGNPFTILPLSYGQSGNYGPGIYLLSTSAPGSSAINFYDITNDIGAANEQLNYYTATTDAYSVAANAAQAGAVDLLDVGDCRAQDGFYLNGIAHFVHTDNDQAWSAIRYNRLNISTLVNTYSTTTFAGTKDYAYPSIASFSNNINDKSVLIGFHASGSGIYPEFRVKSYDNAMNSNGSILVKSGLGPVTACLDPVRNAQRWGDYTGACRKHNAFTPTVWVNGGYGGNFNYWNTWVAEIYDGDYLATTQAPENEQNMTIVPNPTSSTFRAEFYSDISAPAVFELLDETGRLVKTLYKATVLLGDNIFSFNTSSLPTGVYVLRVLSDNHQIYRHENIVIAH